jgi:hypothetical protein
MCGPTDTSGKAAIRTAKTTARIAATPSDFSTCA